MKILITGGAGFIGSNLARKLKIEFPNCSVTIFDKFNTLDKNINGNYKYFGDYKNLLGLNVEIIAGDLSNESDLQKLLSKPYDIIFHQGAISDTTVLNQELVLKTNTISFRILLEYCKDYKSKLIYASSAGTYGNTKSPNVEGYFETPENIYGFSKLQMDIMARNYISNYPDMHIVGLRYFNVYGPGEIYKRKTSSMILQLAKQILDSKSVKLFKNGEQRRDFVYIEDVIDANILAIEGLSGVYNIGSGVSRSFNDIISIIASRMNYKININYIDNPFDFYQNNTQADLTNSFLNLKYTPKYSLEEGIDNYLNEILNYSSVVWKNFLDQ